MRLNLKRNRDFGGYFYAQLSSVNPPKRSGASLSTATSFSFSARALRSACTAYPHSGSKVTERQSTSWRRDSRRPRPCHRNGISAFGYDACYSSGRARPESCRIKKILNRNQLRRLVHSRPQYGLHCDIYGSFITLVHLLLHLSNQDCCRRITPGLAATPLRVRARGLCPLRAA